MKSVLAIVGVLLAGAAAAQDQPLSEIKAAEVIPVDDSRAYMIDTEGVLWYCIAFRCRKVEQVFSFP